MNKIVFFETHDWEESALKAAFPDATFTEDHLDAETVTKPEYAGCEIASTFINSVATAEALAKLPSLKFVATRSTGFDHIDCAFCKTKNITVSNVPEYGSNTVAEHTFALILSLTRKIYQSVNQSKNLNFEHDLIRGVDLHGKTIGIVGLGKIGINVLRIAKGFGMNAVVYNHSQNPELRAQYDFKYVDLAELLKVADIITLHLPLMPATKHIINRDNILTMKKGSYIVNTARGGLIETEALVAALEQGILEGVGLDVLEEENELSEEAAILSRKYKKEVDLKNLIFDHMLINHPKVLITPHNAFNSVESLARITNTTIQNIQSFIAGQTQNTVE
jgi:D-lactate dehydrogenase